MAHPLTVVVATRNAGKLAEIREIFRDLPVQLKSLRDYSDCPEVEETGETYLENARLKARAVAEYSGEWALADDSGLEVEVLQGRPGVRSARYAGAQANDRSNLQKVVDELSLQGFSGSSATFRCVMVLCHPDRREFVSEGEWKGEIILEPRGTGGFGYDPIFFLPQFDKTVAELPPGEKNRLSHRAQALAGIQKAIAGRIE